MHTIKYILFALFAASFANVMAQDDKSKSEFRARGGYDFSVDKGGGGIRADDSAEVRKKGSCNSAGKSYLARTGGDNNGHGSFSRIMTIPYI